MLVENTEANRIIRRVVASMAIENMYFEEKFINEAIKVAKGEKTSEQLRREVINGYV